MQENLYLGASSNLEPVFGASLKLNIELTSAAYFLHTGFVSTSPTPATVPHILRRTPCRQHAGSASALGTWHWGSCLPAPSIPARTRDRMGRTDSGTRMSPACLMPSGLVKRQRQYQVGVRGVIARDNDVPRRKGRGICVEKNGTQRYSLVGM